MTRHSPLAPGGQQSALERVETSLAAILEHNPKLNAVSEVFAEAARSRAAMLDATITSERAKGILHGVPILVKDLVDIAGHATGFGSTCYATAPAPRNAPVIDRLEAEGAIILGTTNMVEFAVGSWGTNAVQGTPWNPTDLNVQRVPGGSSSGSAVAVAAGFVPIAFGSDTGGSIRIPAALCGIVGFKPSYGLIPLQGVAATGPSFDTLGPLTRSVADARRATEAAAGIRLDHDTVSLDGLSMTRVSDADLAPIDPRVLASYQSALTELEEAGVRFEEVKLPLSFPEFQQLNGDIVVYEAYRQLHTLVEDKETTLDPYVRDRVQHGAMTSDAIYRQKLQDLHDLRKEVAGMFRTTDGFVLPGTPLPALPISDVDESQIPMSRYTRLANVLNLCAISLPLPSTPLPHAIQLALPNGEDAKLLATAERMEALFQDDLTHCQDG